MSFSESINGGFSIMFSGAALITSFFAPPEVSIPLIALSDPFAIYAVGLLVGNSDGWYSGALYFFFMLISVTILVFAINYWRYGLISNGVHVEIIF